MYKGIKIKIISIIKNFLSFIFQKDEVGSRKSSLKTTKTDEEKSVKLKVSFLFLKILIKLIYFQ